MAEDLGLVDTQVHQIPDIDNVSRLILLSEPVRASAVSRTQHSQTTKEGRKPVVALTAQSPERSLTGQPVRLNGAATSTAAVESRLPHETTVVGKSLLKSIDAYTRAPLETTRDRPANWIGMLAEYHDRPKAPKAGDSLK